MPDEPGAAGWHQSRTSARNATTRGDWRQSNPLHYVESDGKEDLTTGNWTPKAPTGVAATTKGGGPHSQRPWSPIANLLPFLRNAPLRVAGSWRKRGLFDRAPIEGELSSAPHAFLSCAKRLAAEAPSAVCSPEPSRAVNDYHSVPERAITHVIPYPPARVGRSRSMTPPLPPVSSFRRHIGGLKTTVSGRPAVKLGRFAQDGAPSTRFAA